MTPTSKIPAWIATSTDVKALCVVRTRAEDQGNQAVADAITARITALAIERRQDPMTFAYDKLIMDNKRLLGQSLARTIPMVPRRVAQGMSYRAAGKAGRITNMVRLVSASET